MKRLLGILIILSLIASMVIVVLPVGATPVIHEYYNTNGDADSVTIYGNHWVAEQFTSEVTSHTISSVRLLLKYGGSPSTFTVSIYNAAAGVPTTEITSATFYASVLSSDYAWYNCDIPDISLLPSTQYAIVVSCPSGDNANYIMWYKDSDGGLANAVGSDSADGSITWVNDAGGADYLFEVYGDVVFQVIDANVYTNYIETGDWLIVIEVLNDYPEYTGTEVASLYFNVQLLDVGGAPVIGATVLKDWGVSPCAIYLSKDSVTALTWGSAYIVRMNGTFTGTPYTDYTLSATVDNNDWIGSDLRYLDQYCLKIAKYMNVYNNNVSTNPYTQKTSLGGEVLTTEGGGYFIDGIPNLSVIRPNLFETSEQSAEFDTGTATNAYDLDPAHTWQNQVGTVIADDADAMGDVLGISAKQLLQVGIWGFYVFALLFVFASKTGAETIFVAILCAPVLMYGVHLRLIEFYIMAGACALMVLVFVVKVWFSR